MEGTSVAGALPDVKKDCGWMDFVGLRRSFLVAFSPWYFTLAAAPFISKLQYVLRYEFTGLHSPKKHR